MNLTMHFTLEEMIHSDYAEKHDISNSPSEIIIDNLIMLCVLILEPLRTALDKPIIINSGYRCKELNKAVGGVPDSHHLQGLAADINFSSETELKKMLYILKDNEHLDLALIERSKSSKWLHVQLPLKGRPPRHRITSIYITK